MQVDDTAVFKWLLGLLTVITGALLKMIRSGLHKRIDEVETSMKERQKLVDKATSERIERLEAAVLRTDASMASIARDFNQTMGRFNRFLDEQRDHD